MNYTIEDIKYWLEGKKFINTNPYNPYHNDVISINKIIDMLIKELPDEEDGIEAVINRKEV